MAIKLVLLNQAASKTPTASDFYVELRGIGDVAGLSLESIINEVRDLVKGMKTLRDFSRVGVVADFVVDADAQLRQLESDAQAAVDACYRCVSFFGEFPSTDVSSFFALVAKFIAAFKVRPLDDSTVDSRFARYSRIRFYHPRDIRLYWPFSAGTEFLH